MEHKEIKVLWISRHVMDKTAKELAYYYELSIGICASDVRRVLSEIGRVGLS